MLLFVGESVIFFLCVFSECITCSSAMILYRCCVGMEFSLIRLCGWEYFLVIRIACRPSVLFSVSYVHTISVVHKFSRLFSH